MTSSYYTVEAQLAGVWTFIDRNAILDVSGVTDGGGTSDNGVASAADSSVSFDISAKRSGLPNPIPTFMPVRVTFTIENTYGRFTAKTAVGRVIGEDEDGTTGEVRLKCEGIRGIIQGVRAYSPMFDRVPAALKTTVASPTSANTAGISPIEWYLLTAGGWPLARSAENANALFYYDLDTAPYAPDQVWFAGEVGWDEILNLLKAVGGQFYQRSDGVLVYRQPLSFGEEAAIWTLSDTGVPGPSKQLYGTITRSRSHRNARTQTRCTFKGFRVADLQTVQEDTEQRQWSSLEVRGFEILLDKPLNAIEAVTGLIDLRAGTSNTINVKPEAMVVVDSAGLPVAQISDPTAMGGYTHNWKVDAQRITVTIRNRTGGPIYLYKLTVRGEPLVPGATGTVTVGTAGETKDIDSNPFIQKYSIAEALCYQSLAFEAAPRDTYHLEDLVLNPQIDVGKAVLLDSQKYGISGKRCVIVSYKHDKTGHVMSLDLTPVDDLPKLSDFYQVGTTDYAGQSKRLGW